MTFGDGIDNAGVGGEGRGVPMIDPEMKRLKEELCEAQCVLTGEMQQIGNLAQKNRKKVIHSKIVLESDARCSRQEATRDGK